MHDSEIVNSANMGQSLAHQTLKIMSDLPIHFLAAQHLRACTNALGRKVTG
jgi:hypothetical protein